MELEWRDVERKPGGVVLLGYGMNGVSHAQWRTRRRRQLFQPWLRPAGLRYRKPHTVPHTFAGLLIEAGNPSSTCRSSSGTTPRPSLWLSLGTCCPEGTGAVDRWTTRQSAILAQPTTARPKQLLVDPSRYPRGI